MEEKKSLNWVNFFVKQKKITEGLMWIKKAWLITEDFLRLCSKLSLQGKKQNKILKKFSWTETNINTW